MSFVGCSLPYFSQWLITLPLSALLPFQSLITESSHGDQLLVPTPFCSGLTAPFPLCSMFLFSSLFIIQFFCFYGAGVSLFRGYAGLSLGWLWEYHVMLICSPVGLLDVS
jgi:hypothetical protein